MTWRRRRRRAILTRWRTVLLYVGGVLYVYANQVTSAQSGDDTIDGDHLLVPPPSLARQLADEESAGEIFEIIPDISDMIRTAASTCSTNEPRGLLDTPTQNGMFVSSWEEDTDGVAGKDMDSFVERVLTAAEEGKLDVLEVDDTTNH